MSDPAVLAVMLVNGRAAMVQRAINCFLGQTYRKKRLLIWDSTPGGIPSFDSGYAVAYEEFGIAVVPAEPRSTIGALRNEANALWNQFPIIVHWDSDDWSHPQRIEEQVALLHDGRRLLVGYRELLFWDTRPGAFCGAWIYQNYDARWCAGTSFCYRRDLWEYTPFENAPHEDQRWWMRHEVSSHAAGVSAFPVCAVRGGVEPRMICQIHGDSTEKIRPVEGRHWRRAPEWDDYCRERMAL